MNEKGFFAIDLINEMNVLQETIRFLLHHC